MSDSMNVCEAIVDILARNGVKRVYGVAGDALNPFTDALSRDRRIAWIGVKHEGNGALAAYAESALSGGLGACAGTLGPGALHLLNGLYEAKREGGAVVAITGQLPYSERGVEYFQSVGLERVFGDVCAYQALLGAASQVPRLPQIALQTALAQRQPVRIEIPSDVALAEVPSAHFSHPLVTEPSTLVPPDSVVRAVAKAIDGGKRVTLFCGVGCRTSRDAVLALAAKIGAPVVHTARAKDIFDDDEQYVVGLTGLIGIPSGYRAVRDCDVLIMLGTNFPYDTFIPDGITIAQVDTNLESIGRRAPVSIGVYGDVGATLAKLTLLVEERSAGSWLAGLRRLRDRWIKHAQMQSAPAETALPIHPPVVARMLSEKAAADAVLVPDGGSATVWTVRYMRMHGSRRIIASFNHGSIGVGFGMAMGASAIGPERQVWLLTGDGAFGMAPQDLLTAKRFGWPVKVVILNNRQYAFVKMEMEVAGLPEDPAATDVVNMDFVAYAKACGVDGVHVDRVEDLGVAIDRAIATDGPFILDVAVTPGILVMPPHTTFDEAKGFAFSKFREGLLGFEGDHAQFESWMEEFRANL
jgi:thiamine pyrophosphate-dependent acetolactate synthase large subunit-like protein